MPRRTNKAKPAKRKPARASTPKDVKEPTGTGMTAVSSRRIKKDAPIPVPVAQTAPAEEAAAETLQASEAQVEAASPEPVEAASNEMPLLQSGEEAMPDPVAELVADAPILLAEAVEAEIAALDAAAEQANVIVEAVLEENIAVLEAVVDSDAAIVARDAPPRMRRHAKPKRAIRAKASTSPSTAAIGGRAAATGIQQHMIAAAEKGARLLQGSREMAKANVEALLASSDVTISGIRALGCETVDFGQKSLDDASSAWKRLAASGSLAELIKLQSHYACLGFESLVAETSKLCGTVLTVSEEAALPIARRYSATIEQVKSYGR